MESVALTTLSRIRAGKRAPDDGYTEAENALHQGIIDGVSAQITDYLGRHTLRRNRTEIIALRPGRRVFRLDGYPVEVASVEVRYAQTVEIAQANNPSAYGSDLFALSPDSGTIRLANAFSTPAYAVVTYTGGVLEADADPLETLPSWIAHAATLQCQYLMARHGRLGSSREVTEGAGAVSTKQYGRLETVRDHLESHRRAA